MAPKRSAELKKLQDYMCPGNRDVPSPLGYPSHALALGTKRAKKRARTSGSPLESRSGGGWWWEILGHDPRDTELQPDQANDLGLATPGGCTRITFCDDKGTSVPMFRNGSSCLLYTSPSPRDS
eukprot:TRINITY_DN30260_c0_g1_i1.p2 TRINITY_DN30260_c0_g1~~TRINITY_DN30260_c0_g1_i1.p2  ORF type:complete len:124 (-),score=18.60 TRINITY_DN30260_c0_g1_i1:116-487(-)